MRQSNDVDWEIWGQSGRAWPCQRILSDGGTSEISLGLVFFGKVLER